MTYRIDDFRVMPRGQKIWASADITLHYTRGDILRIHGIKLLKGRNGLFIAMPTRRIGDKFQTTCERLDMNLVRELRADMIKRYHAQMQTHAD